MKKEYRAERIDKEIKKLKSLYFNIENSFLFASLRYKNLALKNIKWKQSYSSSKKSSDKSLETKECFLLYLFCL